MRYIEVPHAVETSRRLVSLDALRGFNFIWILGGDGALLALAQMSKGKGGAVETVGSFLGAQMTHVAWEGFRFYDLIFPLFVFIMGVAIALSLPRLVEREGLAAAHGRVLRRALILYVLGLVYYGGISDGWDEIRWVGVLQRIALCYFFGSLLFLHLGWRSLLATLVALLAGYWALMTFVPVPGVGAGSFAPDANLANWIDTQYLPGRMWDETRDPEGLLSTLPAIGTCLLGILAGLFLKNDEVAPTRKSLWLIGAGIAMIAAGYLWSLQFPIVKAIWTSSFVLVAGGWSAILLGAMYQIVDVWGYTRWATVFIWIGANAILLYFLNNIVGYEPFARRLVGGDIAAWLDRSVTPGTGALGAHLVGLGLVILLAAFLYRRKIFLRV
jgi:predicted acyltransferase